MGYNWVKTAAFIGLATSSLFAGGATTNNNHSAAYLRSVARNATTENDAPYYNPAGTSFMKDGFHISLSNQTFWQGRTITTESPLFEGGKKEYEGNTFAPSMPGFHATWHHGNLAISSTVGVIGGGGSLNFKHGIPSFDAVLASQDIPGQLTAAGLTTTKYDADIKLDASSYQIGIALGAAYQFANMFGVYVGGRATYSYNHYEASLTNFRVNPTNEQLGLNGDMVTFNEISERLEGAAAQYAAKAEQAKTYGMNTEAAEAEAAAMMLGAQAQAMAGYAEQLGDKYLDVEQEGWGFAPIFGASFQYKGLTLGVKYEMKTRLEMENSTKKNDFSDILSGFDDGEKDGADVPAVLALGLSYAILPNTRISLGYNLWFDSDADFTGNTEDYIKNSHEFMYGVEVDVTKKLTLSGGLIVYRCDRTDDYVSDLSQLLNTSTVGLGFAYRVNDNLRFDVGYYHTRYNTDTDLESYGLNTYKRTSRGFGIGIDLDI